MFSMEESEPILEKWRCRRLELKKLQALAEQIVQDGEEGGDAGANALEDRWRYCEIIQGGWKIRTFEWPHMKLVQQIPAAINSSAVSPDTMLVAGGYEDGTVHVWRLDTGMLALKLPGSRNRGCTMYVIFSGLPLPCRRSIEWKGDGVERRNWGSSRNHSARHRHLVHCVFARRQHDGYWVSGLASQDCGKVWDVTNGNLVATLTGHKTVIWTVSFSPDSLRIITGSEDNTSRVWDAQNGDELVTIREHTSPVWASQFSADGQEVMTGSCDSTVSICDSYVGTQRLLLRHVASTITSGCYSPDSEFVVAGYAEGSINVWSTRDGSLMADLKGHEYEYGVKSVTITADNKHIVSTSEDGSIRIWSLDDICKLATAL
ncbi:hypothetical protein QCA50_010101 [Cerrena zonata]|uniref:Uncharacterized protein n=1 Tax=Cerrena zonata TaxID=2478898 RepID=A0AAW0FZJ5_9APHY